MKKILSCLVIFACVGFLLIPFSVSAKPSAEDLPSYILGKVDAERVAKIEKEGVKEIGTKDTRSHDKKEMAKIKSNPEGWNSATGEIVTNAEAKKLKSKVKSVAQQESNTGDVHINTMFPPEDRIRITPTTVFPYRSIALLQFQKSDGAWYRCTGAIIDDNTVLTAAHCLYENQTNSYMTSMIVIPGNDGALEPYGHVAATNLIVTNAYASKEYIDPVKGTMSSDMIAVDYGVIKVPAGTFSASHGYFKLSSSNSVGTQINITGYPAVTPDGTSYTMWRALGDIMEFGTYGNDQIYSHKVDVTPGQSGSPAFNSPDGTTFNILGVQSAANSSYNLDCDMTSTSITNINAWK